MRRISACVLALALGAVTGSARGEDAAPAPPAKDAALAPPAKDIREEVPLVGYTLSAFGASRLTAGIAGFAGVAGGVARDATQVGGGGRLWGSPVDRLTLLVEVNRTYYGEAAPAATTAVRILGDRARGFGLGAALTYRSEAFAELAGELEASVLFSLARGGWHIDANLVGGAGFEDEEIDGELKLRAGYDVTRWLRLGVDGRARRRFAGEHLLPGKNQGDMIGGPEILVGLGHFFLGASTGPSTVGVASGVGWSATGTFGGALL